MVGLGLGETPPGLIDRSLVHIAQGIDILFCNATEVSTAPPTDTNDCHVQLFVSRGCLLIRRDMNVWGKGDRSSGDPRLNELTTIW